MSSVGEHRDVPGTRLWARKAQPFCPPRQHSYVMCALFVVSFGNLTRLSLFIANITWTCFCMLFIGYEYWRFYTEKENQKGLRKKLS
mmetsp:Transcript_3269/g.6356  ORF Transcript_3269/g.6356 Transcript_3269/m.6356 type:complete len:87 (-) Transcript_3269:13-273(-)